MQLQKQYENAQKVKEADYKVKELEYRIFAKNLLQMKRTLEDAAIKSPAKGILTFANSQIGAQIGAGTHIATISDLSSFMVQGEIIDSYASKVQPGGRVSIETNGVFADGWINSVNPLSLCLTSLLISLSITITLMSFSRQFFLYAKNGNYFAKRLST